MISASDYFKSKQRARNYHKAPTQKQKEYAIQLGIDPTNYSFSSLSLAIDEAKEELFERWKKKYNELDAELQRSGNILDFAEKATTLKKKEGQPRYVCGPCPECGGNDRWFADTKNNLFACRGCDFRGGLAQLAAYVWKCSTWDAIDSLTGQSPRKEPVKAQKAKITPAERAENPKLLLDFSDALAIACERLGALNGKVGREYLLSRGITEDAWQVNRVGVINVGKRPAVCFPHWLDGQVVSLNRRIISASGKDKTRHMKGGTWGLYHLATISGAKALIVVEGEINGLSVWLVVRAAGWLIDVISVGSEGAFSKLTSHIASVAKSYDKLIVWADKAKVADDASRIINHHAPIKALRSPILIGEELDANDLLVAGVLTTYLERVLPTDIARSRNLPDPDEDLAILPHDTNQGDWWASFREWVHEQTNGQLPNGPIMPIPGSTNGQAHVGHLNKGQNGHDGPHQQAHVGHDCVGHNGQVASSRRGGQNGIVGQAHMPTIPPPIGAKKGLGVLAPTTTLDGHGEHALWAAKEIEDTRTDAPETACPQGCRLTVSPWWADLETQAETDTHAAPNTHEHLPTDAPTHNDYLTGSDELLYLCVELCDSINDLDAAGRWYLVCEDHYIDGDYTSLRECYEASKLAISQGVEPNFPDLPPPRPNYDDLPVIAKDSPFHNWVWAARAVQAGHDEYLACAQEWAEKIEDRETRERTLKEMARLAECGEIEQLALL